MMLSSLTEYTTLAMLASFAFYLVEYTALGAVLIVGIYIAARIGTLAVLQSITEFRRRELREQGD